MLIFPRRALHFQRWSSSLTHLVSVFYQGDCEPGKRIGRVIDVSPDQNLCDPQIRKKIEVHNARSMQSPPTLQDNGFQLVAHSSACKDFYCISELRTYMQEVAQTVRKETGHEKVLVFDYEHRTSDAYQGDVEKSTYELPARMAASRDASIHLYLFMF